MKTPLFFIAALVAFFALPFDFTIMASVLFAAALCSIAVHDYRRTNRVAVRMNASTRSSLRLAA